MRQFLAFIATAFGVRESADRVAIVAIVALAIAGMILAVAVVALGGFIRITTRWVELIATSKPRSRPRRSPKRKPTRKPTRRKRRRA